MFGVVRTTSHSLIPLEATALTGITDEMIAGHRIDEAAVGRPALPAEPAKAHKM
jgi:hypothetical protein